MRVIVIGGTGHIGSYLVPKLVSAGHDVVCVSRHKGKIFNKNVVWQSVEHIEVDRTEAESEGNFGAHIRKLQGEVVIDLICFTLDSATMIADALLGQVKHFIHCGTMWVHGSSEKVPTTEDQKRKPFGTYGISKAAIEAELLTMHRQKGFPVTILHPGHIAGPGRMPINPAGNVNPDIFVKLALGQEVVLPNLGMETVHHVHVDDVAQSFIRAIENPKQAIGESFHIVSEQALTLRGYANAVAAWYGHEAQLTFQPWDVWKKGASPEDAKLTWDHIAHSPNGSIEKAKTLLKYRPRYASLQAVLEAIRCYAIQENIEVLKLKKSNYET